MFTDQQSIKYLIKYATKYPKSAGTTLGVLTALTVAALSGVGRHLTWSDPADNLSDESNSSPSRSMMVLKLTALLFPFAAPSALPGLMSMALSKKITDAALEHALPCWYLLDEFNSEEKIMAYAIIFPLCVKLNLEGWGHTVKNMLSETKTVPQSLTNFLEQTENYNVPIDENIRYYESFTQYIETFRDHIVNGGYIESIREFIVFVSEPIPKNPNTSLSSFLTLFLRRFVQLLARMVVAATIKKSLIEATRAMQENSSQREMVARTILGALETILPVLAYMESFTKSSDYVTQSHSLSTLFASGIASFATHRIAGNSLVVRSALNQATSNVESAEPNAGIFTHMLPEATLTTMHEGESRSTRAAYLAMNLASEGIRHAAPQIMLSESACPPLFLDWFCTIDLFFAEDEMPKTAKIGLAFVLGHAAKQASWLSDELPDRLMEFREATIAKDLLKSCYAKFVASSNTASDSNEPVRWGFYDSYVVEKIFDLVLTLAMCHLIQKIKSVIQDHLSNESQIIVGWAIYAYLTTCGMLSELADTVLKLHDHNIQELMSGPQALVDITTKCSELLGICTAVTSCAKDELAALKKNASDTSPNPQLTQSSPAGSSEDTSTASTPHPPPSDQPSGPTNNPSIASISMFQPSINSTEANKTCHTLQNLPAWLTKSIGVFPRDDFARQGIAVAEANFKMHTFRKELLEIQAWVGDGAYDFLTAGSIKNIGNGRWSLLDSTECKYSAFVKTHGEQFKKMNRHRYCAVAVQYIDPPANIKLTAIVTRGTIFPNVLDLDFDCRNIAADKSLLLNKQHSRTYCHAGEFFVDHIRKKHLNNEYPDIFVGHSLGCSFNMWMDARTRGSKYILNIDSFGISTKRVRFKIWETLNKGDARKDSTKNIESIIARKSALRIAQYRYVGHKYKLHASHASRDISNKYNEEWEGTKMAISKLRESLSEESKKRQQNVNEKTAKRKSDNRAKKMERRGHQQTSAASCPAMR